MAKIPTMKYLLEKVPVIACLGCPSCKLNQFSFIICLLIVYEVLYQKELINFMRSRFVSSRIVEKYICKTKDSSDVGKLLIKLMPIETAHLWESKYLYCFIKTLFSLQNQLVCKILNKQRTITMSTERYERTCLPPPSSYHTAAKEHE